MDSLTFALNDGMVPHVVFLDPVNPVKGPKVSGAQKLSCYGIFCQLSTVIGNFPKIPSFTLRAVPPLSDPS